MSQGQGGRGGTGHTLLYYIGLDGKEGGRRRDRTAQVARCTGQGKGRQKDRRTEKRAGNLQLPSLFDATNFVTVLYGDFCLLY